MKANEGANKLLPCPKCGHTPDIEDPDFLHPTDRSGESFVINCYDGGNDSCDYEILTSINDIDVAVKLWNRLAANQDLHVCDKCFRVSEDKPCLECYCAVCGDELECGWCVECSSEDEDPRIAEEPDNYDFREDE
jgi:hypothetical protein